MPAWTRRLCFLALLMAFVSPAAAEACAPPDSATSDTSAKGSQQAKPVEGLGVSRVVEIDTSTGPLYGDMSKYLREESFLGPKEIVLTFDDGPLPWITKSILDTLDRYCTKATFFSVGQMALAYPDLPKDVIARGHTLGAHTWSHPMNIARLNFEKAKDQIERGFAAVALAAGQPIAPFFRFPGLSDSDPLLSYLQTRGIASFTVDVVSNDSFIASPSRLLQHTLQQVEQRNGGILLFHDIKASTAKALPGILKELQARGYKVVHMRAKTTAVPIASLEAELAPVLAKKMAEAAPKAETVPVPQTVSHLQPQSANDAQIQVTALAPVARTRVAAAANGGETGSVRRKRTAVTSDDTSDSLLDKATKPPRQKLRAQRQVKKAIVPIKATTSGSLFPF